MTGPFCVKQDGVFMPCEACSECSFLNNFDKDNPSCMLVPCPFVSFKTEVDPMLKEEGEE